MNPMTLHHREEIGNINIYYTSIVLSSVDYWLWLLFTWAMRSRVPTQLRLLTGLFIEFMIMFDKMVYTVESPSFRSIVYRLFEVKR
jgi:hypothetical protein